MKCKVVVLLLALAVPAFAANSHGHSSFDPVAFLLGEWKPSGSGGAGATVFHSAMDGQIIVRESRRFVKRSDGPASQRDLLVIYKDQDDHRLRAVSFDEHGTTIHYNVDVTGLNEVTFVSEDVMGRPRYRLSYKLDADETLRGKLDVAAPNASSFKTYQRWTAYRIDDEGWL